MRVAKLSLPNRSALLRWFESAGVLKCGGEQRIRTPGTFRFNGFQDRRDRPLCQLSIFDFIMQTFDVKAFTFSSYPDQRGFELLCDEENGGPKFASLLGFAEYLQALDLLHS